MSDQVTIVHHDDGEQTELRGSGYAVRCAAHIAHENLPDARWALKVLNTYGHLIRHEADAEAPDARDPDHSRSGIFVHHNCWKCNSGKKPCVRGNPNSCEHPQARND